MDGKPLSVGDRVILRQPYLGLPTGTPGTIVRRYETIPNLYRVRFDTTNRDYPIHRSNFAAEISGACR
jgi:hypothetical protein